LPDVSDTSTTIHLSVAAPPSVLIVAYGAIYWTS